MSQMPDKIWVHKDTKYSTADGEYKGCGMSTGSRPFRFGEVLPYLRPMSSMTEEEREEYNKVMFQSERYENDYAADIDYLNAHHFDFRNLIGRGLAIEVTEENNPYET